MTATTADEHQRQYFYLGRLAIEPEEFAARLREAVAAGTELATLADPAR